MEYTTLDKISENLDSKRKPITSSDRVEGEIPYYGASGIVDYVKDYIFDESLLLVSEDGANLLARSTPIAFSVTGKTWINNHAHVLRFSNENLQKFVEIYLNSISLESYVTGSAQPKLNQKMLNGIPIPVVDDSQIEIIVNSVENLKSIIELRKQELACLDELIKARFVELFGDPIINSKGLETRDLKDVLVLKAGDFTAASDISAEPTKINIYPCYGGNGIRGYVAEYNQEGEYSLIGRQGALSGNVQYAMGKFKNTEHALLVTPMIQMNSIWLNQLLLNLDLKRYQTGAAQPGLSVKNLQDIQIPMAPIDEQSDLADFVHQVNKSKVAVQKALEETQLLFNSLMQKYFG